MQQLQGEVLGGAALGGVEQIQLLAQPELLQVRAHNFDKTSKVNLDAGFVALLNGAVHVCRVDEARQLQRREQRRHVGAVVRRLDLLAVLIQRVQL